MAQLSDSSVSSGANQGTETRKLIHDKIVAWLRDEAHVTVEQIDYNAPFYDLGVDSLGAMAIAAELQQETRKIIDPEVMYDLENITELADYLDSLPIRSEPAPTDKGATAPCATPPCQSTSQSPNGSSPASAGRFDYFQRRNRVVNTLKDQGLYFFEPVISEHDGAWVVADGQRMLMLGSYEYLGLLQHPSLREAATASIKKFGTGHHGARLVAGTTDVHLALEARLAGLMMTEDAIVFSSGYVANLATIGSVVGVGDYIVGDQWNHASIVDGCHMSSADFVEFQHNDMQSLAERLSQRAGRRTLVVVDAIFSMDGDIIDLPAVVDLCKQHDALLMVDEAHSLGVLGARGRGIQEHFGLSADDIDIKMGTLSKTLAGTGGFVAANQEITTYLRHHARGYIFSGALSTSFASIALAAIDVIESEPELLQRLWDNVKYYIDGLKTLGFDTGVTTTPIIPIMTKNNDLTLEMTKRCRSKGLLVVPVCFPAVPMDAPRLRTCMSASLSHQDLDFALDVLGTVGREIGLVK